MEEEIKSDEDDFASQNQNIHKYEQYVVLKGGKLTKAKRTYTTQKRINAEFRENVKKRYFEMLEDYDVEELKELKKEKRYKMISKLCKEFDICQATLTKIIKDRY